MPGLFRQGKGCNDQAFAERQVCKKYLANGKAVFWTFMYLVILLFAHDLEKDMIDRKGMWEMLRVYGVGGKLLKAVQSFYVDSRVVSRWE